MHLFIYFPQTTSYSFKIVEYVLLCLLMQLIICTYNNLQANWLVTNDKKKQCYDVSKFFLASDNFKEYLIWRISIALHIFVLIFFSVRRFSSPIFHPYPTFKKTTSSRQPQIKVSRNFKLSFQKLSDLIYIST